MKEGINTSAMLSLLSQLIDVDERPKVAKKLATKIGADDLLILVRDEERHEFVSALGFSITLPNDAKWKKFLDGCITSGIYTAPLPHPATKKLTTITAIIHEDNLAIICIGAKVSTKKIDTLRQLIPVLSSLFHYEKFVDQTSVHINHAKVRPAVDSTIAQKLDAARRSLRAALQEKDAEIHERIRSEAALAESEQRFRFMAESLATMIFTSEPNGDLDYISPRWQHYTGLPLDTLRGEGIAAALHPDDKNEVLNYWLRSYASGTPIEQEVRIKCADGTYRWHLSHAEAMRNDTGEIIMWVGSSTDIEDVKSNMEKKLELEERTALLTQQQKDLLELSAAKDEFIRLASHQLRTPATGVKMYIGMLMEGYADPPTESQLIMLHQAYKSNDRQLHIIDDLLKVATIDAGKVILNKETCNLEELVSEVVQELSHTVAKHRQQVTIISPEQNIIADVDKRYMRMVIENIIDNASKYSPDDTTITVLIAENEFKEITITDQGVGITKKDQVLLFKKFSRVHNIMSVSAAGTGLGLYWAKEIITLHGGSISLTSRLRHGSTFVIKLP